MNHCITLQIVRKSDIDEATREARKLAVHAGFEKLRSYQIATAASELACNILIHGGVGALAIRLLEPRYGIELLATDYGPGIADIALAMQDGYSSIGSLGSGLPGVARLMDEIAIDSVVGQGTKVCACKWL
ncbi:MAG: anti-sigma regulatory factor [Undibacterium sp.]|uniref:anti-sigma regulatory factor n=1 Tax=Undibacterium sp. TaxID=1914977 RepID=UPI002719D48C|nr:anti-sigma regulatory factor [Undibacterium sp.]MDO8652218.1 anti-sigma regulatory factor [Undibacterium sp.]